MFERVFLARLEDPSLVYAFVIAVQWLIVINLLYMFFPFVKEILLYKRLITISHWTAMTNAYTREGSSRRARNTHSNIPTRIIKF